ncbi:hypothetical protein TNIN_99491 [Trichonephila inaurata madagascariensis]|uniref:Uncharacterized protein n=1 Tax=Trichonephila inaurata madagascariensis TaxID=2747483 RepID=A0A8X7CSA8_9ARAC|nr:hypothetical protein TNIN_99491 [Trichonephila inaurata madagascariensis]
MTAVAMQKKSEERKEITNPSLVKWFGKDVHLRNRRTDQTPVLREPSSWNGSKVFCSLQSLHLKSDSRSISCLLKSLNVGFNGEFTIQRMDNGLRGF